MANPRRSISSPEIRELRQSDPHNLPTDPDDWPYFDSFEERYNHIRDQLLDTMSEALESEVRQQMEAAPPAAPPVARQDHDEHQVASNIPPMEAPHEEVMSRPYRPPREWLEESPNEVEDSTRQNFNDTLDTSQHDPPWQPRVPFLDNHNQAMPNSPGAETSSSGDSLGSDDDDDTSDSIGPVSPNTPLDWRDDSGDESAPSPRESPSTGLNWEIGYGRGSVSPESSVAQRDRYRSRSPFRFGYSAAQRDRSRSRSPFRSGYGRGSVSPETSVARRERSRSRSPYRSGYGRGSVSPEYGDESSPSPRQGPSNWMNWEIGYGRDSVSPESSAAQRDRSRIRSRGRDRRGNSPRGSPSRQERSEMFDLMYMDDETISEHEHYQWMELMQPHLDKVEIAFVGDQYPVLEFHPCRGDLIVFHPGGRRTSLPNSNGYLASYLRDGSIIEQLKNNFDFSNRSLVLRIGNFEEYPDSWPIEFRRIVYRPFETLDLYAYNPTGWGSWKFLGHQANLKNSRVTYPADESPGFYLKVGSPLLKSTQFEPLVPRRGDVIIKREAWNPDFRHEQNFWYSMVKWHRGANFPWMSGDMLVRRFVDNHPSQNATAPDKWGWAELYEFQGPHVGWIFWGRTKHVYDTPWSNPSRYMIDYQYDDGDNTDEEMEWERVNPRVGNPSSIDSP